MAAEEFVLIPKHTYIHEQPHASQNSVSTETLPLPLPPTPPSTPLVDPGEQSTGLLTEDEIIDIRKVGRKRRSGLWMRKSERIIK